jgi:hypothetical protein
VRSKACLVAQGFSQVEGLDFEETFAPVAHLEAISILLAFATSKGFKLYQIDVKSDFLNGVIQEEVFVRQPLGFENLKYPDRMYKFLKDLYGLKQAPSIDKTLFTLKHGNDFLLVQIYVDDIIFHGLSHSLVSSFQEMMENEF